MAKKKENETNMDEEFDYRFENEMGDDEFFDAILNLSKRMEKGQNMKDLNKLVENFASEKAFQFFKTFRNSLLRMDERNKMAEGGRYRAYFDSRIAFELIRDSERFLFVFLQGVYEQDPSVVEDIFGSFKSLYRDLIDPYRDFMMKAFNNIITTNYDAGIFYLAENLDELLDDFKKRAIAEKRESKTELLYFGAIYLCYVKAIQASGEAFLGVVPKSIVSNAKELFAKSMAQYTSVAKQTSLGELAKEDTDTTLALCNLLNSPYEPFMDVYRYLDKERQKKIDEEKPDWI